MLRRKFILLTATFAGRSTNLLAAKNTDTGILIHFLRHATFLLQIGGLKLLIDPMLNAKEAMDPVGNAGNTFRIPMVDLPVSDGVLLKEISELDAVIITHTHRDHWDAAAHNLLPKTLPLIIQPYDEKSIREKGFSNLIPVDSSVDFKTIKIHRTGGQHGTGEIGARMGQVSGFVIEHSGKRIYIAGDTVWCAEVENAISTHKPDYIVVNAGAAQFLQGGPITMNGDDVVNVCKASGASTKVIAVHMETINHCLLKRNDLKKIINDNSQASKCIIPTDGQMIRY